MNRGSGDVRCIAIGFFGKKSSKEDFPSKLQNRS